MPPTNQQTDASTATNVPDPERRRDDIHDAFERGVAAERINARLNAIDDRIDWQQRRLDAINGSVHRTGERLEDLTGEIRKVAGTLAERDAVNEALIKQATDAVARRLTRWQRLGVIVAGFVGTGSLVAAVLQALPSH